MPVNCLANVSLCASVNGELQPPVIPASFPIILPPLHLSPSLLLAFCSPAALQSVPAEQWDYDISDNPEDYDIRALHPTPSSFLLSASFCLFCFSSPKRQRKIGPLERMALPFWHYLLFWHYLCLVCILSSASSGCVGQNTRHTLTKCISACWCELCRQSLGLLTSALHTQICVI